MFLIKTMVLGALFSLSFNLQASYQTQAISLKIYVPDEQPQAFYYHAQGDGNLPKVILLGGGPGFSSWNLEPIQTQISKMGYRVLLTDMLGIGENSHINPKSILSSWIQQVDRIVANEKAENESVILVGHSWGGLMAMLYARAHNDKVSKLILLNPVDPEKAAMQHLTEEIQSRNEKFTETDWSKDEAWSNEVDNSNQNIEYLTLRQIQQVLPTYFMDYQLGTKYAKQFTVKDFDIELNIQAWKEYDLNPIKFDEINRFQLPISFIDCNQDYLMPYNLNAMQKHIEFSEVSLIDQCGHFPWIEKPKIFYSELKQQLMSGFSEPENNAVLVENEKSTSDLSVN
ncbi:alpha/beta fold hydrolase [Thiomicrorhabdus lithotrophica]|uniref:Alpha/beta hydrolase n=1 Tax=Thiomicrorhabdus lithotrophica TaxID=2949997 RepID=A0ABY8CAL2_9GAMM|nr:alpha/beta hydrolase [Thiomicrorhabdus lithotrophica]WEJ61852.1 alpha/beta hydrolase [Thiomicrorhabdus lithotrophica]